MYESIYEPINAVRPPSELSSTYSISSLSQTVNNREHETEVDTLSNTLGNSVTITEVKKNVETKPNVTNCK